VRTLSIVTGLVAFVAAYPIVLRPLVVVLAGG